MKTTLYNLLQEMREESNNTLEDKGLEAGYNVVKHLRTKVFPKLNDEELQSFRRYLISELGLSEL